MEFKCGGSNIEQQELEVIRSGQIHYRDVGVEEVSVPWVGAAAAALLDEIRLVAVVAGTEVDNPFVVTEVYVRQNGAWALASVSFTRLLTQ